MPDNQTHGFDIVVEANVTWLNDYVDPDDLHYIFDTETEGDVTIDPPGAGSCVLTNTRIEVDPRSIDIQLAPERGENQVRIVLNDLLVNINSMQITCTPGGIERSWENIPMTLQVTIVHPLSSFTDGTGRRAIGFDFTGGLAEDAVTVEIEDTGSELVNAAIETFLADRLLPQILEEHVSQITVFDESSIDFGDLDFELTDLAVRVVNDHCLAILIQAGSEMVGEPDLIEDLLSSSYNSVLLFSNYFVIGRMVLPRMVSRYNLAGTVDELFGHSESGDEYWLQAPQPLDPAALSEADTGPCGVPSGGVDADEASLDALTVTVTGSNSMAVSGRISMVQSGLTIRVDFDYTGILSLDEEGNIVLTMTASEPVVEVEIPGWAYASVAGWIFEPLSTLIATAVVSSKINDFKDRLICMFSQGRQIPFAEDINIQLGDVRLDDLVAWGNMRTPARQAPTPTVWIEDHWEATDCLMVDHQEVSLGRVRMESYTFAVTHRGRLQARTEHMVFPLDIQWCIAGTVIAGDGVLRVDGVEVSYGVDRDQCELTVEQGGTLRTEVCVSVIDSRGLELCAETDVDVQGKQSTTVGVGIELLQPLPELMHPASPGAELLPRPEEASSVEEVTLPLVAQWRTFESISTSLRGAVQRGTGHAYRAEEFKPF